MCNTKHGIEPFNTNDCPPCLPMPSGASRNCLAMTSAPICLACEIANAHRRGSGTSTCSQIPTKEQLLKTDDLLPGDCVSMDHYVCPERGRLLTRFGKAIYKHKYCGGLIMADHASGYIQTYHQVSLGSSDTIQSKRKFEQHCREAGVMIKRYHSDNGTFRSEAYRAELRDRHQTITFSGTGAHHQNGVAERAIRTVTYMARAMLVHLSNHWPDEYDPDLWPFAMDYAVWLHNHTPDRELRIAPIEVFCQTRLGCHHIQRARVFGSPTFVLDPRIQDGRKIPKWDPRSARGQFLGFSTEHSSTVGLIRNLRTGSVTRQFHVVHDEMFTTVPLTPQDIAKADRWPKLFLDHRDHHLYDDIEHHAIPPPSDTPPPLSSEWLPDDHDTSDPSTLQRENDNHSHESDA
jgi:hypothetical protein